MQITLVRPAPRSDRPIKLRADIDAAQTANQNEGGHRRGGSANQREGGYRAQHDGPIRMRADIESMEIWKNRAWLKLVIFLLTRPGK